MKAFSQLKLIQGDALEALRGLPRSSHAVCGTSPPYNIGHNNAKAGLPDAEGRKRRWQGQYPGDFDDLLSEDEYVEYHQGVVREIMRVLKPDGLLWYVHRRRPNARGLVNFHPVDWILQPFPVRHEVIWYKANGGTFNLPTGGKKYTPVQYLANRYETIFVVGHPSGGGRVTRDVAKLGDVWEMNKVRVPGHPSPFPVALAARCIAGTACEGPVLDPFLGTGSTALAALAMGRYCTGIELIPETMAIAEQRLEDAGRQSALM